MCLPHLRLVRGWAAQTPALAEALIELSRRRLSFWLVEALSCRPRGAIVLGRRWLPLAREGFPTCRPHLMQTGCIRQRVMRMTGTASLNTLIGRKRATMALFNRRWLWQRRTTDRRQAKAHECDLGTCMNRSSRNQGTTWRGRANQT
jgi:hypothetical protein